MLDLSLSLALPLSFSLSSFLSLCPLLSVSSSQPPPLYNYAFQIGKSSFFFLSYMLNVTMADMLMKLYSLAIKETCSVHPETARRKDSDKSKGRTECGECEMLTQS